MKHSSEFNGGAFNSAWPTGKCSGQLILERHSIAFHCPEGTVSFPLKEIHISRGGAGNRLYLLTHPQFPEWTLYAPGRPFARALNDYELLKPQLKRFQRQSQINTLIYLSIFFLLIALPFGIFSSKDRITLWLADIIPPQWEVALGQRIYKEMSSRHEAFNSTEIDQELKILTEPLLEALGPTDFEFNFYIINEPTPNAFALPGGPIVIHSGLITEASNVEEVLGVLAHEISHITCRHTTRQLIQTVGLYSVVQLALGDVTGVVAILADNGTLLMSRSFSREHEQEADRHGLDLLTQAEINPTGLVTFFEKLLLEHEEKKRAAENSQEDSSVSESLENVLSFLSTHPATEERISYLKELIQKNNLEDLPKSSFNFKKFQENIYRLTAPEFVK